MSTSGRRPAEEALRASEERYRRIVETAEEGVWLLDPAWKTTFVNDRMSQLLGWPPDHMPARHFFDFMDEEGRQLALDKLTLRERGARISLEVRFIRRDGRELWTLLALSPITDEAGQFTGALAMVTDITERKLLEDRLRQAQKMEAMGQLAGGVAHDFNNILTSFIMNIYVLKKDTSLTGPARELLADIESDAKRAANLTRQLLLFSRRQTLQFKPLEINETVANLLKMLRRLLGEHIAMEFHPADRALWVEGDVGMIEQVLVNLCINARDAMPSGGQLRVDTHRLELDEAAARLNAEARPGRFVCLSVTDTGSGMNETMLKRVFEPFFTTKEEGKGTGLGLATVYAIVKQHHGWVEVVSAVQAGSVFRVFLPAGAPAGSKPATVSTTPVPVGGRETILLVEDEPVVRQTVTVCLRQYGYTILAAQDGNEALALWERHRASINLLFTDMAMPGGVSGLELAERLKRERPDLKVIVGSGYSELIVRHGIPNRPGFTFLPKPYEPEPLLAGVRKALDAK